MHRYPSPVANTFQDQPKKHARCKTPGAEWANHDDLDNEEQGEDAEINLIGNEIWDIVDVRISHIT